MSSAFYEQALDYYVALYPDNYKEQAQINIYCEERFTLKIHFQKGKLPPNHYTEDRTTGVAYVETNQFLNYLDLLRNEKPIYVFCDSLDAPQPSFIVYAGEREPVGEGEV